MVQLVVLILQSDAFKPLQKKRKADVMNVLPVKPQMVEKNTHIKHANMTFMFHTLKGNFGMFQPGPHFPTFPCFSV